MSIEYNLIFEEKEHSVQIKQEGEEYLVSYQGKTHRFSPLLVKSPIYSFLIDQSKVIEADVVFHQDKCEMNLGDIPYQFEIFDPRRRFASQSDSASGGGQGLIAAPMPGKVVDLKVEVGDEVKKGSPVIIVEAMKMQNELTSLIDGIVKEITVKPGDTVESGQRLVLVEKGAKKDL